MLPSHHFTRFIFISLTLHALTIFAAVVFIKTGPTPLPFATPVRIVDLPREVAKRLPPVSPPAPAREIPRPQGPVPVPKKFGAADEIKLPKTLPPSGIMERDKGEKGAGGAKTMPELEKGPLPFLTQRDIDEIAKKGMPERKPGDDSVTLDTDEFKFISYNRWLKIKVEGRLRYPELAAISGFQGVLYLRFDIMKDGSLANLELLKSSGYKILDDEALRAIRDSAPFQPLPDEWRMDRYAIRAAVVYYLSEAYIR